jgi:hypothetical protein
MNGAATIQDQPAPVRNVCCVHVSSTGFRPSCVGRTASTVTAVLGLVSPVPGMRHGSSKISTTFIRTFGSPEDVGRARPARRERRLADDSLLIGMQVLPGAIELPGPQIGVDAKRERAGA